MPWMLLAKPVGHEQLDLLTDHLIAAVSEDLLGLRVHEYDSAILAHNHHRIWRRFEKAPELLLGSLAVRDVANGTGHQRALFSLQRAQTDLDREFGAVLAKAEQLEPGAHRTDFGAGEEPRAMLRVVALEPLGNELFDGLPEQFLPRVAEQLLGLRIDDFDVPVHTHNHHRVGSSIQKRSELVLHALSVGHVADGARNEQPFRCVDRAETDFDWKLRAIFAQAIQIEPGAHRTNFGTAEISAAMARWLVAVAARNEDLHLLAQEIGS